MLEALRGRVDVTNFVARRHEVLLHVQRTGILFGQQRQRLLSLPVFLDGLVAPADLDQHVREEEDGNGHVQRAPTVIRLQLGQLLANLVGAGEAL